MKKSPESQRKRRLAASISPEVTERELTLETRIQSGEPLAADSELSADRKLKNELAAIQTPSLPAELRQQVMAHAASRRITMGWMALAAAVVMSLLVVFALPSADDSSTLEIHRITAGDWAQLDLALNTLNASGRRVAQVTEREVRPHLKRPDIQITSLPDSETVWSWFRTSLQVRNL